jgi:hypothetical protein
MEIILGTLSCVQMGIKFGKLSWVEMRKIFGALRCM